MGLCTVLSSVADPERSDANPGPDPTFHADSDPDPNLFLAREIKNVFFKIFYSFLKRQ